MKDIALNLSSQQASALKDVANWLKSGARRKQVFRLFGYAGTGKTTIARHLAADLGYDVVYSAFTGKAALMMKRNGCDGAATIHSLIYTTEMRPDGSARFQINPASEVAEADLIVLDECSMVDGDLAKDLKSFGKPILALGDPAQLPPVNGRGFFTKAAPDAMLTEIHRQARENPILRLATEVREGGELVHGTYGQSRVISIDSLSEEELLAADQVLVGMNATRRAFNTEMREKLGRTGVMPEIDDRLVCLRNNHRLGIFNGGLFTVATAPTKARFQDVLSMKVRSLDFPERAEIPVRIRPEFFEGTQERLDFEDLRNTHQFDYGYALTAHKAQGSQWPHVIIVDESFAFRDDGHKWLYTAITRASERVTIIR